MAENDDVSKAGEYQATLDRLAKLRALLVNKNRGVLFQQPHLAEIIDQQIQEMLRTVEEAEQLEEPPPDSGLLNLAGLGKEGIAQFNEARLPPPVPDYDEEVTSERLLAIADLYYIYQHERLGVFRVIFKMQELFRAGRVRLTSGPGALGLYQFDRQKVLRYTQQERQQAYRRVLGYTNITPPSGAKPNLAFHTLFVNFNSAVAQFFRDQRISHVIRPEGRDLTFGSVAVVRRAGLDLRNNLKDVSYGHTHVLRVEVLQLLEKAFKVLAAEDVRRLFGAENAWDTLEEVLRRFLGEQVIASQRSRMAVTGRNILRWLAQPDILNNSRVEFEALLKAIAEESEEWLTSAESLGLLQTPQSKAEVIPFKKRAAGGM